MVIWRNVIKHALRALLPTVIIPGLFTASILYYFGLTPESVLIIVMLAQLYIIWFQADASLRQTKISEIIYDPVLLAELNRVTDPSFTARIEAKLKNVGEYPAYNVTADLETPVPMESGTFGFIGTIEPEHEKTLLIIDESDLRRFPEFSIYVDYTNVLGRDNFLTFAYPHGIMSAPLTALGHTKLPGTLLNSVEDLNRIFSLATLNRRIRKFRKIKKSS